MVEQQKFLQTADVVGMAVGDVVVVETADVDAAGGEYARDVCPDIHQECHPVFGDDQAGRVVLAGKRGTDPGETERQPRLARLANTPKAICRAGGNCLGNLHSTCSAMFCWGNRYPFRSVFCNKKGLILVLTP